MKKRFCFSICCEFVTVHSHFYARTHKRTHTKAGAQHKSQSKGMEMKSRRELPFMTSTQPILFVFGFYVVRRIYELRVHGSLRMRMNYSFPNGFVCLFRNPFSGLFSIDCVIFGAFLSLIRFSLRLRLRTRLANSSSEEANREELTQHYCCSLPAARRSDSATNNRTIVPLALTRASLV